jgi:DNA-binding NarL/FixJ family response regulator
MPVKIAFVEDNKFNQLSFRQKVNEIEELEIIFVAADGHECLEQLKRMPHDKMPQIIFVDLEMPGMNGIDTINIGKSIYPQIHFIVFSVFDDDDKIFEAIRGGASGYLLKNEPGNVLYDAVLNVLEIGGAPLSPPVARKALNLMSKMSKKDAPENAQSLSHIITDREREILQYMVNGWDSKRIAVELNLSVLTVRKHIANLYSKLHVTSKAQIISMAHKNNWV